MRSRRHRRDDGGARSRPARRDTGRGVVVAALTGLLSVLGHVAGGGALPDLVTLAVLAPLASGVVATIAGRRAGFLPTAAVLGAGQVVLHSAAVLLHVGAHHAPSVPWPRMVAAHAVVTVVLAVVVTNADAALTAVRAACARTLPRRLTPSPVERPLRAAVLPAPGLPARLARILSVAHTRRGPPVPC